VTRVDQVLSGAGPYDAVTGQALAWRELLARRGIEGGIYADYIDPRMRRTVNDVTRLEPAPDDVLVIRHSAYSPRLRQLVDAPQRKLLVYHNVTPPRYLWNHESAVAVACAMGRGQLGRWGRAADVLAADSAFNARELERAAGAEPGSARVVPILVDPDRLSARGDAPVDTHRGTGGNGPLVLVVGRLVPNKRHDLVLDAFAAYQRSCAPDARLLCIGESITPTYRALIERLAERSGARGVHLAGGVSQPQLNASYAAADALLSMSEHEGFCVPLLEAFHFGVPVVARPAGAMPEVGGDAVLWTDPPGHGPGSGDVAVAAELLDLAVRDTELRDELARRGRARLEEYAPERVAERIDAAVDAALAK
jgi:glycosyltransferase involved in cell wall biosynthesis